MVKLKRNVKTGPTVLTRWLLWPFDQILSHLDSNLTTLSSNTGFDPLHLRIFHFGFRITVYVEESFS